MPIHTLSTFVALILSVAFGVAGLVQLREREFVRTADGRPEYPPGFYRVPGALKLLAALFLAIPNTRVWGVALAEMIIFVAVVLHLRDREYGWAVPGIFVMAALPPVLLAARA